MLLALYATQINVNELAVNFEHSTSNVSMLKRLEALEGCLKALEDWLQIWDRLPAKVHLSLTFLSWIQLIHAIVAVFKLSIVDNIPAWSPAEVRARLDLLPLLDRLADQLALSDAALNIIVDDPGEETSECYVSRGPYQAGILKKLSADDFLVVVWTKSARILRMIKRGIQQDYPVCFNLLSVLETYSSQGPTTLLLIALDLHSLSARLEAYRWPRCQVAQPCQDSHKICRTRSSQITATIHGSLLFSCPGIP